MSRNYDNWERLVGAAIKKEQFRQMALAPPSRDTSFSSTQSHLTGFASSNRHDDLGGIGDNANGSIAAPTIPRAYNRRDKQKDHFFDVPSEVYLGHLKRFSLRELQLATSNFSNYNVLGMGGSFKVYKGRLADGMLVAVKRLKEAHTPYRELEAEAQFQTEVETIGLAVHRNLQRLHGFCTTPTESLLVYPYMANGSVASCLRGRTESQPPLDWPARKRIALGSAEGLTYLHEHCDRKIIHRDFKASHIMLDDDFEAVVGDFGLAILMDHEDTHVTTDVRGTNGHICPEYLSTGKVSEKTDVFGYGIMLLELITGQRAFNLARLANDEDVMLLDWVKGLMREEKLEMLVDADLKGNYLDEEMDQLIQVALFCAKDSPNERPNMSGVVRMLRGVGFVSSNRHDQFGVGTSGTGAIPGGVAASAIAGAYNPRKKQQDHFFDIPVEFYLAHLIRFSLDELQAATNSFSSENVIGWGGFGKVYKARFADGMLVAVKRIHEGRTQDEELQLQTEVETQFQMEVQAISTVSHRNLQRLHGFCTTTTESLLVYPYMANGSVASCLRGRPESQPPLDWHVRKQIAVGSAGGLAYLHEHCNQKIIHRDIKAANILLDDDFEAVVGDFGLAILMDHKDTHVTTDVRGTGGYICPEYLHTGKVSEKADVFGYGIMLLELITGQKVFDLARLTKDEDVMLLDWVKELLREKKLEMLVDADLKGDYIDEEVEQLIQVALLCTQSSPKERPNMSDVVTMFQGYGLAKRWQEKIFRQEFSHTYYSSTDLISSDSNDNIRADELSGPR